MSSPAMKLGNWLRNTFSFVEKHTEPLKEDTPMSAVDEIVLHTLLKHDVARTDLEKKQFCILIGDLKISRPCGLGKIRPKVEYKGEVIGFCNNDDVLQKLDTKMREYYARLLKEEEPYYIKREQEREARLAQILNEVKGSGNV